jgi:hypothetical protein
MEKSAMSDLIERLRRKPTIDEPIPLPGICREAADALEAKDKEIAELFVSNDYLAHQLAINSKATEALIETKERLNIQHNAEIARLKDELESKTPAE